MPLYGRFLVEGEPRFAEIELAAPSQFEGATAHFISGDLFTNPTRTGESAPVESLEILPPINPPKLFAIGLNYADHAAETGSPIPAEPILFNKAPSCIVGPNDDVILPKGSAKTDWEVELAIVIGKRASYVHANEALDYVAGYCVCHDVSEREFQLERGGTWTKGKGCPTFGPLGPWLVTPDEIADVQNLGMWLDVNGERMQTGSTRTMIFDCRQIVSYLSHFMLLEPGDVITTGTPPGVGMGMKPARFLKAGDVVTLGIDSLGEQRQTVVAFDDWTAKVAAGEPTN